MVHLWDPLPSTTGAPGFQLASDSAVAVETLHKEAPQTVPYPKGVATSDITRKGKRSRIEADSESTPQQKQPQHQVLHARRQHHSAGLAAAQRQDGRQVTLPARQGHVGWGHRLVREVATLPADDDDDEVML